ncbi:MAG: LysR family transcriptional regulator [Xanthomonadales bacterium]|nr:LysR family transcriptional regulator [Xanthomonadales bacterium]
MRLRHIEVFHAVYNCGSITGAARLLNVSQPSVSKVLAHAEQQLGFPLFNRHKGKIVPTREAERLIDHVNHAYRNINELRRVSKNLGSAESGVIRIAVTPALGIDIIPAAIASYLEQHPDTMFEIETLHLHQVVRALRELRIDFGIVFNPPATQGIKIDHLATAEFVAISNGISGPGNQSKMKLEELDGKRFVSLNTRSPLGQLLETRFESSNIKLRSVANVETYQMAKALVANGAGMALIDEITARSTGHDSVIARYLEPSMQFEVSILHTVSDPLSIITQRFINHLKTEFNVFLQRPLNQ